MIENIIIEKKVENGRTIYYWHGKPYYTEYLARKAAERAAKIIEKSIPKTYV